MRNRVLVEASPRERIWGIGMDKNKLDIENPAKWCGLNLLGFALMVRYQRLQVPGIVPRALTMQHRRKYRRQLILIDQLFVPDQFLIKETYGCQGA
jgi:hypothetical protein